MQIFLCHASEDREIADQVCLALIGAGHKVFFDRESLPPGGDYHVRIRAAVEASDLFVFLVSPNSVAPGSYALTELKYCRGRWPSPAGRVLPVRVRSVPWDTIPAYLKAVTVLEPEGNIPAEVAGGVAEMTCLVTPPREGISDVSSETGGGRSNAKIETTRTIKVPILVAVIGLVGALGAAVIANWDKLFPTHPPTLSLDAAHKSLWEPGQQIIVDKIQATKIFFDYDSTRLKDEYKPTVERLSNLLRDNPGVLVEIQGHSGPNEKESKALEIGGRRALEVKNFLVLYGTSPDRITVLSGGSARPSNPANNADEEHWADDRRVTIRVQGWQTGTKFAPASTLRSFNERSVALQGWRRLTT